MFGIDFSEFLVIGVVALIVLGPERLPKVARTAGHLLGRLQRYAAEVKQQVKNEMDAEDFKHLKTQFQEVKEAASGVENSIRHKTMYRGEVPPMSAVDEIPPSSLEFVETPTPPDPSPQLELPLANSESDLKPAPDSMK